MVLDELFDPMNGDRETVINIVIVITDGKSSDKDMTLDLATRSLFKVIDK